MFYKKATKIDEIFTVDLTLCSKCQIDGEDFVDFCGLLRKHELHSVASIYPKYDDILFVELRVQYKKLKSSVHVMYIKLFFVDI